MIKRTLFLIPVVLSPLALVLAEDWPQWQGPQRTSVSKEKGLLQAWPPEGPKLLWTFGDAGHGIAGMSIVGDRLYSMGSTGKAQDEKKDYVYAVDLKTQKRLWSVKVGKSCDEGITGTYTYVNGPTCTPTLDGTFLYAISAMGDFVCVDTTTGKKVWSQHLVKDLDGVWPTDTYTESPLVDGDLVLATPGGDQGAIAAFDKKTGKLKWRSTDFTSRGNNCNASMIAIKTGGVRQYVQTIWGGSVAGVRASDGKLLWRADSAGYSYCTPIFHNNCVYIATRGGCKLLKLTRDGDEFNAEEVYDNNEVKTDCGGFVRVGKYIYIGASDGWICQNFETGEVVWKEESDMGEASVVYADGTLYCYHQKKGDVLLLKATPKGYQELGRFCIPQERPGRQGKIYTRPVVADGKLYLRLDDLIFCYDIRKPR